MMKFAPWRAAWRCRTAGPLLLALMMLAPGRGWGWGWGNFRGESREGDFRLETEAAEQAAPPSKTPTPTPSATPANYDFNVVRMFLLLDRHDAFSEVTDPEPGQLLYPAIIFSIDGDVLAASVPFKLEIDGTPYCAATAPGLEANAPIYIWCGPQWLVTEGHHAVYGELDPANVVAEPDETNNSALLEFTAGGGGPTATPTAPPSPSPSPSPTASATPTPTVPPTPSPSATATPADCRSRADFDCSGCTDLSDFLFLLDHWFQDYQGQTVGLDDFLALLDNWNTGSCS